MAWQTPKTDWVGTDSFNASDWLRIVGNIQYIANAISHTTLPTLLTDVTDGITVLTSDNRNEVLYELNIMYFLMRASWNHGYVADRVNYGAAWNSEELNIIEDMLLNMKRQVDSEISNRAERYAGEEIYCGDTISVGLI